MLSLIFVKFSCLLLSVGVDGFVVVFVVIVVVVVVDVTVYYYGHHILLCLPVARNIGGSIKIVADLFASFFITIRTSQV